MVLLGAVAASPLATQAQQPELPVQKYELAINLRTAKALGLLILPGLQTIAEPAVISKFAL
jgi:hypothetical protein